MNTYASDLPGDMPMSSLCETCGATLGDEKTHAEWHRKLDYVAMVADSHPSGLTKSMEQWRKRNDEEA